MNSFTKKIVVFTAAICSLHARILCAGNGTDDHAVYRSDSHATMAQAPPVKMIEKGIYELGGVRINKIGNFIEFPAKLNMNKGLLEYLLVGSGGKLHESLLTTAIEPYSLQCSLLLLGLKEAGRHLEKQGDAATPEGEPVKILVRTEKHSKFVPIEKWIKLGTRKKASAIDWVFTGSLVIDGTFIAQQEKSIIAVYHDPAALIDHIMSEGGSDEIWFANEKTSPPTGTDVTVRIEPVKIPNMKKDAR